MARLLLKHHIYIGYSFDIFGLQLQAFLGLKRLILSSIMVFFFTFNCSTNTTDYSDYIDVSQVQFIFVFVFELETLLTNFKWKWFSKQILSEKTVFIDKLCKGKGVSYNLFRKKKYFHQHFFVEKNTFFNEHWLYWEKNLYDADIGMTIPTKKFIEEMFLVINIGVFFTISFM